jgi:ubiquitin carboxyl-terminal hydrolase MINDY-1/2
MDLNPQFTAVSSFRPAGDGGELKLFDLTGIRLVHGWLVDPDSSEFDVISRVEDYDTSVNLIVSADHLTKGQLVRASENFQSLVMDVGGNWTPEEREKVEDGTSSSTTCAINNDTTSLDSYCYSRFPGAYK